MFELSPKQSYEEIVACIFKGLTPLLTSSPGLGKSSITKQVAQDYKLKLLDLRLSQCLPEDLQGLPMRNGNKASFVPFDTFPLEGDEVPDGYNGWFLFLDELTSAPKSVQAASYKLILDRMVGSHKLHPAVAIAAAGNKVTDKAVVNQLSTALQSRVIHYELAANSTDWVEWAFNNGIDHRIIGFISYMPSKLMDFRPDHHEKTFPCPRTWEFLSLLIKGQKVSMDIGARVAGTIGEGTAVEFITFAQVYDDLPKYADIVADPKIAMIPAELGTKYATVSMLIDNTKDQDMDQILDYVQRFQIEMQILFCRGITVKLPKVRSSNKKFGDYLVKMVRYL